MDTHLKNPVRFYKFLNGTNRTYWEKDINSEVYVLDPIFSHLGSDRIFDVHARSYLKTL